MAPRSLVMLAACAAIPATPAAAPVTLTEVGSTLLFPLLRAWAAGYRQQYPRVSIATAGTGSGAGIKVASAGTVDIGASDAYLSSGDMVKNPRLLNIPLAISAQQVDYHLPGSAIPWIAVSARGPLMRGHASRATVTQESPGAGRPEPGRCP